MSRIGRRSDGGFTLVELVVVVALMALLGTLGLVTLTNYTQARGQQGGADQVVSLLRLSAQKSLTEGVTYCVHLDPTAQAFTSYRRVCGPAANRVGTATDVQDGATLVDPTFVPALAAHTCPTVGDCVYFYPRGTASEGALTVTGSGEIITIEVKGLTSRVTRS